MAEAQRVQTELLRFLRATATSLREIALRTPEARPDLLKIVQGIETEAADLETIMINSADKPRS